MARIIAVIAIAAAAAVSSAWTSVDTAARRPAVAPAPWCASVSNDTARFMLLKLRPLASSTDPLYTRARDSLAAMPRVSAAEVVMVNDETLCERAARSADTSFVRVSRGASPVYLARVGARYAVYPPGEKSGEFSWLVFTDSLFHVVAATTF